MAFSLVAAISTFAAIWFKGPSYVLLYPAASFGLVAAAYFGVGPAVFGKRRDGTLPALSTILLFPYLSATWLVWRILRIVRHSEPPFHSLTPRILIGRRLFPRELPSEVEIVVDLTCEFTEPRAIRCRGEYVCLPTLDGMAPSLESVLALTERLAATDKTVYIHCAEGYGRTGVVAAALLLAAGQAQDAQEAVSRVREIRPNVRLGSQQTHTLERYHKSWLGRSSSTSC